MIAWTGHEIDTTLFAYTGYAVGQMFRYVTPIALTWLTIRVLMFGYNVLHGSVSEPVPDFIKSMLVGVVVVSFATMGAVYHDYVIDVYNALTLDVAKVFAPPGSDLSTAPNVWELIQVFNDKAGTMVSTVLKGNVMTVIFWVSLVAVVIFAFGNVFFLLASMLIVLMTKGFGTFLIAIGPVFIIFLMFDSTRQWFVNWLGSMFGLVVLTWLSFFLLGFSLMMQDKILEAITLQIGSVNVLTQSIVYLVLCCVFAVVLWSAPSFVHGLTGGAAAQMGVQMVAQIYHFLRRGGKGSNQPSPNPGGGNTASRSHGFAYRAGSAVGSLTGVQWGFQRLAAAGRGRNP